MTHLNFQSIFSGPENLLWFALGVISVQVWQWVKAKYKDYIEPDKRPHPFKRVNWLYVAIAFTWMLSIFVGVDNQRTYNFAANLAKDVQRCQLEFNTALKYRADINAADRELGIKWQQATTDRASKLSNPPPNIQRMEPDDPERLEYEDEVEHDYYLIIQALEVQRQVNEMRWTSTPLPEPTCGNEVK